MVGLSRRTSSTGLSLTGTQSALYPRRYKNGANRLRFFVVLLGLFAHRVHSHRDKTLAYMAFNMLWGLALEAMQQFKPCSFSQNWASPTFCGSSLRERLTAENDDWSESASRFQLLEQPHELLRQLVVRRHVDQRSRLVVRFLHLHRRRQPRSQYRQLFRLQPGHDFLRQ